MAVPLTAIEITIVLPLDGEVMVTTGAVWSILNDVLVTGPVVLPARSVQLSDVTVTARPWPDVVFDWIRSPPTFGKAAHVPLSPDSASVALNRTVTSVLCQPAPFAAGLKSSCTITGAVLSILNAVLATPVATLPATSAQLFDVTVTALPSPVVVFDWMRSLPSAMDGVRHSVSRPERPSVALKRFVTSVLYHPATLGLLVGPRSTISGATCRS